jgi:hypothetical protein
MRIMIGNSSFHFCVIPGRGIAANPEPMNTDIRWLFPDAGASFSQTAFMGSGFIAARCPGMTEKITG